MDTHIHIKCCITKMLYSFTVFRAMDSGQRLRIRPGVPNLWAMDHYLLSDQRRHWIRKKVRNECKGFGSSGNQPPPRSVEELSSMKLVPAAKKIGDHWIRRSLTAFKPDSRCVCDLGSTPSPLVNPSVPCCHQNTAIAVETGNPVHAAHDLFMEHDWVFIFPLSLHV